MLSTLKVVVPVTWVVPSLKSHVMSVADGLVRGRGNNDRGAGGAAVRADERVVLRDRLERSALTPALTAPETHWPWLIVAALAAPVVPKIPRVAIFGATGTASAATINHGQCVSGAVKAGVEGAAFTAIAKNNSLVGPYGSATCPAPIVVPPAVDKADAE